MPFDEPFMLGPFEVDATGRLRPTDTGRFPAFSLCWRGCPVEVAMLRCADGQGVIALRLVPGRVPSTAAGGAGRAAVFAAMAALPPLLPPGWRLHLRADHSLALAAETALPMPATATELLGAVTGVLLEAAPYLDVLEEAGLEAGGMVNTCPG